jgi:hypothetical protein
VITWDSHEVRGSYDTTGNSKTRGNFDLTDEDYIGILGLLLMFSSKKLDLGRTYRMSSQAALDDPLHWSTLYGILIEKSSIGPLAYKRVGYFSAMHLVTGEAVQILKGAEVQEIRLY